MRLFYSSYSDVNTVLWAPPAATILITCHFVAAILFLTGSKAFGHHWPSLDDLFLERSTSLINHQHCNYACPQDRSSNLEL